MTIHSDWSRLLHEECPQAFGAQVPRSVRPQVGVIDGHLQLMCLHKGLPSWDAFLQYLFIKPIMLLFAAGCPRVVLCFDCYDHVPIYKSMTQTKRTMKTKVCVFDPAHGLPARIPEDPMLYLMNRSFKIKLVEMICDKLPGMLLERLKPEQEFIVDYKRVVMYQHDGGNIPRVMEELKPMGESDVKFIRYVDLYGSALVHAIDGDYLAIALLYYTKNPSSLLTHQIHIFRQLSSFHHHAATPKPLKQRKKTVKCWVDVQLLYSTILQAMRQSSVGCELLNVNTGDRFTDADSVRAAVFLMLLAGTDFSRSLPWLGPKRLWDNLPHIVGPLLQSTSVVIDDDIMPEIELSLDLVVAKLYRLVFTKHCGWATGSLEQTLKALDSSGLSASVKSKMPTADQVWTTAQNVAWVMSYWKTYNSQIDTPLDGSCGFARCPLSRQITFSDLLLPPR